MKQFFTFFALVALSFAAQAQTAGNRVLGTVIDGSQKTIESATIALLNAKDSSSVKFSVADRQGKFAFENIADGSYMVAISAVGHQKGFSETFELSAENKLVQLKTIELVPVAKGMANVVVTAKRPLIEHKIDRTVVNVEASATNVGATALEVLEKSPGISVDKDGNISLKGKEGVMVLVDGRPTQLGGADLANLLRSMSASQLDQVEIMTNPPARFDAEGNSGVINIKTKKTKQYGYNGSASVSYSQGVLPKVNEGVNFNYRKGKWNLFTNLNHSYRENSHKLDIQRNFIDKTTKDVISYFDQQARMKNKGNSYSGKIGADFTPGKNTTLGVVVSGFDNPNNFVNHNQTDIYNNSGELITKAKALAQQQESWQNFSTNLNFRQVLDTTGKELTADFDYVTYNSSNDQNLSNYYFGATGQESQKGDTLYGHLPRTINIFSGRADYVMPLKKGARFEAGLKSSYVKTDNNAIYDTVHYGNVMHDENRSNHFIYHENINAAYVNLTGPLGKKLNGQLGLRMENTIALGEQLTTGENFERNYTQLFPTAFLQYKANDNNTFGLNYGRRIRRPNYESLNPFIEYLDRYTYQQGNPNLKPQFSHNVELSHSYKRFLSTTLNFSQTNDIIQQVIEQDENTTETYVKRANIATQRQFGIAVSANVPVTKWWTSNVYVNGFHNYFEGVLNGTPVEISGTTVMLNGSQQFKINQGLSAELSGWYRTAGIEGILKTKAVGMLAAGVTQQVFKGKGSVRLNVRDIFLTQQFKASTKYGNVDAAFQEGGDTRVITIGFTYRFSKGKMNGAPKRRTSSANDEQSRVGVGAN